MIKFIFKEHRYLILYSVSIILTIILYAFGLLESFVSYLKLFGYLSSFILGILYTTAFTTPFAVGAYLLLDSGMNPIIGGILGGLGAVLIDIMIFEFSESEIGKTFKFGHHAYKLKRIRNKFVLEISPILAFLIFLSPLPDELAAMLLGLEKYSLKRFAIISFVANSLGVFSILSISSVI